MAYSEDWIKNCTQKISNAIGGGSELFVRHGEEFRLDVDFVCKRISEMRERQHNAMHRAIKAERELAELKGGTRMKERSTVIDDQKVEEILVDGRMIVCIDGKQTHETFEQACTRLDLEYGEREFAEGMMPGGFN